jgi:hypothetical protein
MSKGSSFKERVEGLEKKLQEATQGVSKQDSCFPTLMVIGIAIPFVLLLLLFFLQPSFVQKKEGTKYVRDGKKVFYWSLGITLVMWVGLYLYSYCLGFNNAAMVCAK